MHDWIFVECIVGFVRWVYGVTQSTKEIRNCDDHEFERTHALLVKNGSYEKEIPHTPGEGDLEQAESSCRGPNASNPARGRTLPGQERPSNGRPDASQRRPGSMLCPVGLPGALSVDILALLLYWPTYAPITVRLTSLIWHFQWRKSVFACEILLSYSEEQLICTILCTVLAYFNLLFLLKKIHK